MKILFRAYVKPLSYMAIISTLVPFQTTKRRDITNKSIHLDQTIPGVAFVVRCHIPVQEISLDSMSKWTQNGRLHAIQIFAQQKWISCFNAYAPTQNSAPFPAELSQTLGDYVHKSGIFFGDINADSRNGIFARDIHDKGWYPLTYDTNYEFSLISTAMATPAASTSLLLRTYLRKLLHQFGTRMLLTKDILS